jgi:hypothetical protein
MSATSAPSHHVVLFVKKPDDQERRLVNGDRLAKLDIVPDLSVRELTGALYSMWHEPVMRIEDDRGFVVSNFRNLERKPMGEYNVFYAIVAPPETSSSCAIS